MGQIVYFTKKTKEHQSRSIDTASKYTSRQRAWPQGGGLLCECVVLSRRISCGAVLGEEDSRIFPALNGLIIRSLKLNA